MDSLCNLLACWPQLRTLFLARVIAVSPDDPPTTSRCLVPQLPHLHTLTLRECSFSDQHLTQLFQATPSLRHLAIFRPYMHSMTKTSFLQNLESVQGRLWTLQLSMPDPYAKDIARKDWWPELKELSIEALHLE